MHRFAESSEPESSISPIDSNGGVSENDQAQDTLEETTATTTTSVNTDSTVMSVQDNDPRDVLAMNEKATGMHITATEAATTFFGVYAELAPIIKVTLGQYADLTPSFERTLENFGLAVKQYADLTPSFKHTAGNFTLVASSVQTTLKKVDLSIDNLESSLGNVESSLGNVESLLAEVIPKLTQSSESITKLGENTNILLVTSEKSIILLTDQMLLLAIYLKILVIGLSLLTCLCILRQLVQGIWFIISYKRKTVQKCEESSRIILEEAPSTYSLLQKRGNKYKISEKKIMEEIVLLASDGDSPATSEDKPKNKFLTIF